MLSGSNSRYTLAEQDYLMVSSYHFIEEETVLEIHSAAEVL